MSDDDHQDKKRAILIGSILFGLTLMQTLSAAWLDRQRAASNAEGEVIVSMLRNHSLAAGGMGRMTQQNAAMVEEATAAASSLARQSADLQRLVAAFQLHDPHPASQPAPRQGMDAHSYSAFDRKVA